MRGLYIIKSLALTQAEKKKAGAGDDGHGNPEIERLRKEVQDTKEINRKLRDLLQVFSQFHSVVKSCIATSIHGHVPGAPRSVVGR